MSSIRIDIYGIGLVAEYHFNGEYYPATTTDPEEYPDLIIESVTAWDSIIDIQGLLSEEDREKIETKIWDYYVCKL